MGEEDPKIPEVGISMTDGCVFPDLGSTGAGIPSAGKHMLASIVVGHLWRIRDKDARRKSRDRLHVL
jgi:hypothetical protein